MTATQFLLHCTIFPSNTKSAAEETLAAIATLKQSVLARAFRGELGTNDAADEPAIELLKRTLEES